MTNPPVALLVNVAPVASDTNTDCALLLRYCQVGSAASSTYCKCAAGIGSYSPAVDTITTFGAVTVTPAPVVNVVPLAFVASTKYVPVVGLTLFGLATVGQQFNNVGLTIGTLPVDVSSTYTEPLAAVAEKLAAENANGDAIDVPIFPPVESNTNVVTLLNWLDSDCN